MTLSLPRMATDPTPASSSLHPTLQLSTAPVPKSSARPTSTLWPSLCSQSKRDPAPEGQVKSPSSPYADQPASQLKDTLYPKSSKNFSTASPGQIHSAPSMPSPRSPSRATLNQSQPHSRATGSANGSKLPGKSQAQPWSRDNSSSQPQAPGQQRPQPSITSLDPSHPGHQSSCSGPVQHPSTSSSQGPPTVPSPSGTTIPMQPPNKTPNEPVELAPKASKSSKQQKGSPAQRPTSTSVPELPASCLSESPLESTSESTTEVTCSWSHHHPWLRYLQHCWRLKHLAC